MTDNQIQEAKKVDLFDIISNDVKLRRNGSSFVGCCPFHDEKTPSFYVTPGKGFKCFGCDAKGSNAIDYLIAKGMTFADAVGSLTVGFVDSDQPKRKTPIPAIRLPQIEKVDYLPSEYIENKVLASPKANNLFRYFAKLFTPAIAIGAFSRYMVGSTKDGRTAFVQKDIKGRYRQVKAIPYKEDGHREKSQTIQYLGKMILKNENANLTQCYFGEHLINHTTKPIAIVESEKTAIGMSIMEKGFVWIATGGAQGLNKANTAIFKDREVMLFPDVDKGKEWQEIAKRNGWKCNTALVEYGKENPESKIDIWDIASQNIAGNGILINEYGYPAIWDL